MSGQTLPQPPLSSPAASSSHPGAKRGAQLAHSTKKKKQKTEQSNSSDPTNPAHDVPGAIEGASSRNSTTTECHKYIDAAIKDHAQHPDWSAEFARHPLGKVQQILFLALESHRRDKEAANVEGDFITLLEHCVTRSQRNLLPPKKHALRAFICQENFRQKRDSQKIQAGQNCFIEPDVLAAFIHYIIIRARVTGYSIDPESWNPNLNDAYPTDGAEAGCALSREQHRLLTQKVRQLDLSASPQQASDSHAAQELKRLNKEFCKCDDGVGYIYIGSHTIGSHLSTWGTHQLSRSRVEYKIGCTFNLQKRESQYRTHNPRFEFWFWTAIKVHSAEELRAVESRCHQAMRQIAENIKPTREWFENACEKPLDVMRYIQNHANCSFEQIDERRYSAVHII